MIAAIAIEHLSESIEDNNIGIAYLFFKYNAQADHSTSGLLCALLKQLVKRESDVLDGVKDIYDDPIWNKGLRPHLKDIVKTLQFVCSKYDTVYIIVDALDECANRTAFIELIANLRQLQSQSDVRLLFTSRDIPDIQEEFRSDKELEIRASDEDVRSYTAGQVPKLPHCIRRDKDLQNTVCTKIVKAADGI